MFNVLFSRKSEDLEYNLWLVVTTDVWELLKSWCTQQNSGPAQQDFEWGGLSVSQILFFFFWEGRGGGGGGGGAGRGERRRVTLGKLGV